MEKSDVFDINSPAGIGNKTKEVFRRDKDILVLMEALEVIAKQRRWAILQPHCESTYRPYRDAFVYAANRWCGFSYDDIGVGIGCSRSTVFACVKKFRQELEAGAGERIQIVEALKASVTRTLSKDIA